MNYIISISNDNHKDYIAEGKSYVVQGEVYVPLTEKIEEAKRYTSYKRAWNAGRRRGINMIGTIIVEEIPDGKETED